MKNGHLQKIIEQYDGYKTSPTDFLSAEIYKNKYVELLIQQGFKVTQSIEKLRIDELTPLHKVEHESVQKLTPIYQAMDYEYHRLPTIIVEEYPGEDGNPRYLIGDGNHRAFIAKFILGATEIEAYVLKCENFTHKGPIGLEKTLSEFEESELLA